MRVVKVNDVDGGNLPEAAVANDNLDGEAGQCSIEGNEAAPATRVKTSYADNRRWCFRCTCKIHVEINGRRKPKNVSRIDGQKPRKTGSFACVVKWLSAQLAFDHGMRKKGYPQLRRLLDQYR
jgi:hypothetical protein